MIRRRRTAGPRRVTPGRGVGAPHQRGGRGEREERPGYPEQPPGDNTTMIYGGVAAVVLLLIVGAAVMATRGGDDGSQKVENRLTKLLQEVQAARSTGNAAGALVILDDILKDRKFAKSGRLGDVEALAAQLRRELNAEHEAKPKVADFKRKVDKMVEDRVAMSKSNELWDECQKLLAAYGTTSSGAELRNIREDLRRWVTTESQGNWQKEYNQVKAKIERDHLSQSNFAEAVRGWNQFRETSQDRELHGRIDVEVMIIGNKSKQAAEALIAGGAGVADLEQALTRFIGTDGQKVITDKIRSMK